MSPDASMSLGPPHSPFSQSPRGQSAQPRVALRSANLKDRGTAHAARGEVAQRVVGVREWVEVSLRDNGYLRRERQQFDHVRASDVGDAAQCPLPPKEPV